MVCEKCNGSGIYEDVNGLTLTCGCIKETVKPIDTYVKKVLPKTEVVKNVKKAKKK